MASAPNPLVVEIQPEGTLALVEEIERLRNAIRKHRDYQGDDRCHLDDGELYAVLPEGDTRPEKDQAVSIENCKRFIQCRQDGTRYVRPTGYDPTE